MLQCSIHTPERMLRFHPECRCVLRRRSPRLSLVVQPPCRVSPRSAALPLHDEPHGEPLLEAEGVVYEQDREALFRIAATRPIQTSPTRVVVAALAEPGFGPLPRCKLTSTLGSFLSLFPLSALFRRRFEPAQQVQHHRDVPATTAAGEDATATKLHRNGPQAGRPAGADVVDYRPQVLRHDGRRCARWPPGVAHRPAQPA